MTYYQFAIRQNKIYLNLFIMNYTGVANSIKICPGWGRSFTCGPSTHLNKMHQYYCSYDLVKEQILRYWPQDYFCKLSCSQVNAVDPWRILHGYNAANRNANLSPINEELQYLFYIQSQYQVLDHNTIGATFCLCHLQTSYISAHVYLPI